MEMEEARLEGITEDEETVEEIPEKNEEEEGEEEGGDNEEGETEQVKIQIEREKSTERCSSSSSSNASEERKPKIGTQSQKNKTKEIMDLFYQDMRLWERQQRLNLKNGDPVQKMPWQETTGNLSVMMSHDDIRRGSHVSSIHRRGTVGEIIYEDVDYEDADTDLEDEKTDNKASYNDDLIYIYKMACQRRKVIPLGQFMFQLPETHHIRVTQLGLQPDDVIPICISLVKKDHLSKLDLSGNRMGEEGLKYVMQLLRNAHHLSDLNIGDNNLGSKAADILQTELENISHLKKLNISNNNFDEKDVDAIADILRTCTSLRFFAISHNNIGADGGVALGRSLQENSTLDTLCMSWCNIRMKGARAIAEALKDNTNLDELDIAWNGFSNDGAEALSLALKTNTTLTKLNISANRIGPLGAIELAKMLEANEALEELNVDMNPLTTKGADQLIIYAKKNENSRLRLLDLGSISVTYDSASLLDQKPVETSEVPHTPSAQDETQKMFLRCDSFVRTNNFLLSDELRTDCNSTSDAYNALKLYAKTQDIPLERMLQDLLKEDRDEISVDEMKRLLHRLPLPISDQRKDKLVDQLPANEAGCIEVRNFFRTIDKEATFHFNSRTQTVQTNSI